VAGAACADPDQSAVGPRLNSVTSKAGNDTPAASEHLCGEQVGLRPLFPYFIKSPPWTSISSNSHPLRLEELQTLSRLREAAHSTVTTSLT
jgi:hypothetical protein